MTGAGDLDRRITVERYTTTANDLNEKIKSWSPLISVWARRRDASDGERFAAGQVSAYQMARFTIRYSSLAATVNPKDRILHDGRYWNIHGVKETADGHRRFMEITAVREAD